MLSRVIYQADGTVDTFAVPFPFISRAHVQFSVDGESVSPEWVTDGLVNLGMVAGTVRIERVTPVFERDVDFVDTSMLTAKELDDANIQLFYKCQELLDDIDEIEPDPVVPPFRVVSQSILESVPNEATEYGPDFDVLVAPVAPGFFTAGRHLVVELEGFVSSDHEQHLYDKGLVFQVKFQDQTISSIQVLFDHKNDMTGAFTARFSLDYVDTWMGAGFVCSARFQNDVKTAMFNAASNTAPIPGDPMTAGNLVVHCILNNPGDWVKFSKVSIQEI